jgi:hypothetical protein
VLPWGNLLSPGDFSDPPAWDDFKRRAWRRAGKIHDLYLKQIFMI